MSNFQFQSAWQRGRPTSLGGRIFTTVFFLVFLSFGVFFTVIIARDVLAGQKTRWWQRTPCTIISSKITEKTDYACTVSYTYQFNGLPRTSTLVAAKYKGSSDYYPAQKLLDQYSKGSNATCFVNPSNPAEAVLQTPGLWSNLLILFPLIFVAVGLGGVYFTWRPATVRTGPSVIKHPKVALAIFFTSFASAGVLLLGLWVPMMLRWQDARTWPEVACRIAKSSVSSHISSSGHGSSTTYRVDVLYRYSYSKKRYSSSRYGLVEYSSSNYDGQKQIADQLNNNKKQRCYVNPLDPAEAVLDRSFSGALIALPIVAGVLLLIGGLGLKFVISAAAREHRLRLEEQLLPAQRGSTQLRSVIERFSQSEQSSTAERPGHSDRQTRTD